MRLLPILGLLRHCISELGKVDPDHPDFRELFITFVAAGYVARYRLDDDLVVVLAVRHMREAGYLADR